MSCLGQLSSSLAATTSKSLTLTASKTIQTDGTIYPLPVSVHRITVLISLIYSHPFFADLSDVEARRISDMLGDCEQLPLTSLTSLSDPEWSVGGNGSVRGWQPTLFWRKSSASVGQDHVIVAIGHAL